MDPIDEKWLSPVMRETERKMRERNLTLVGFRDRKGRLRYLLSNDEIVTRQTVEAMIERGILEVFDEFNTPEGQVLYRLKVK